MADVAALLESLHPMREPPPIAPITPYLAMLAVGVAAAATAFVAIRQMRGRRGAMRRSAEAALAASRDLAPTERLAAQAHVLRRLVRAHLGDEAARSDGTAWLAVLDRTFATTFFTQGSGRAFADALYRREPPADLDGIDRALTGLIAQIRTKVRA